MINPTLLSSVSWYVPASPDIPLAQPTANARFRLLNGNSTLVLYHLAKGDSGEFRCRASTGPYAEAAASVLITVDSKLEFCFDFLVLLIYFLTLPRHLRPKRVSGQSVLY